MRLPGFLLLLAGWIIVLAAVALLRSAPQGSFAVAGLGVQLLGLILVFRSHLLPHGSRR
ncbi:MAG TPA: hypothetical protein VK687_09335 [Bryobacteraceae bacterium]|nr:hypothetical protein [Bryobacteraceae bacterium]